MVYIRSIPKYNIHTKITSEDRKKQSNLAAKIDHITLICLNSSFYYRMAIL